KAAADVGTTFDSGWASPLSQLDLLVDAFLESLKDFGAFDAMLPSMLQLPSRSKVVVTTAGATAAKVDEGGVKIPTRLSLTSTQLDLLKVVAFVETTDEVVRFGGRNATNLI